FCCLVTCYCALPVLHSFPTRRSSDLQYQCCRVTQVKAATVRQHRYTQAMRRAEGVQHTCRQATGFRTEQEHIFILHRHVAVGARDRKSTRLNSSHVKISYAVFCLKKK